MLYLLHGGMEDSRSWRRQFDALATDFTLVAWDAPGCGGSAEPPRDWRMPDFARCAAVLAGHLGVTSAHVVGFSWGSSVTLELYRRAPELFRTMTLVSGYAGYGSLTPQEQVERRELAFGAAARPPRELSDGWPALFGPRGTVELATELTAIWADNSGWHRPDGHWAMFHSMADADLRPSLPSITVPTLVVHGELDRRSTRPIAQDLAARIPGARLVVLDEVAHNCASEDPDRFNAALVELVSSR